MSYTELIIFKDGKAYCAVKYGNSWGGAARIWDALFDRYLKREKYDYIFSKENQSRLWALATREDLPEFERAVHAFTFDRFYVRREHFERFSADLRAFVGKYPDVGKVDHLPAWAKWLDENSSVEAVGLYGTSVGENTWYQTKTCPNCGQSTDENEPVPLSEGTELYDFLGNIGEPIGDRP